MLEQNGRRTARNSTWTALSARPCARRGRAGHTHNVQCCSIDERTVTLFCSVTVRLWIHDTWDRLCLNVSRSSDVTNCCVIHLIHSHSQSQPASAVNSRRDVHRIHAHKMLYITYAAEEHNTAAVKTAVQVCMNRETDSWYLSLSSPRIMRE